MENKERKAAREKQNAIAKRAVVQQYKVEQGCADCGYDSHHAALEFDHLPGVEKTRTVASLFYCSWERIWAEIAKCEVVCANCHAMRTMQRLGLYLD